MGYTLRQVFIVSTGSSPIRSQSSSSTALGSLTRPRPAIGDATDGYWLSCGASGLEFADVSSLAQRHRLELFSRSRRARTPTQPRNPQALETRGSLSTGTTVESAKPCTRGIDSILTALMEERETCVDRILFAVGILPHGATFGSGSRCRVDKRGYVYRRQRSHADSQPHVYSIGDVSRAPLAPGMKEDLWQPNSRGTRGPPALPSVITTSPIGHAGRPR